MDRSSRSPSPVEEREILRSWQPDPLVPEIEDHEKHPYVLQPHIVTSKPGKYITIDGVRCLNAATHNYLGLVDDDRLEQASLETARKYGVGSCGPRAFYGTMDIHLNLENQLAQFIGVDEAILYSFAFSTFASAIPAYAKSTDIIFVDEYCNFAIQKGMDASRAKVFMFKHNDMDDLERLIKLQAEEELKKYGAPNKVRTFIIVEGIYAKTGQMCPLDTVIRLKRKYKIRLFVDESRTFGVLGSEGKGITQHLNLDVHDLDLIMISLENAFGGFGGFCAGSSFVVDHQRLAGTGYCFSASLPPLQVAVALEALNAIRQDPTIVTKAQKIFELSHEVFKSLTMLKNISHPLSPIKILILKANDKNYDKQLEYLDDMCKRILDKAQIALAVARYLVDEEMSMTPPSIRLAISGSMTREDILRLHRTIEEYSLDSKVLNGSNL